MAAKKSSRRFVIIRTQNAGVFAGTLISRFGEEAVLVDARRIWYWAGAASLSELAVRGTSKPKECKFPVAVPHIELTQVIELINCTEAGKASIESVPEWSAQ